MSGSASLEGIAPLLEEVAEVSGYLWQKGWAERNAGNLSVDVTGRTGWQPQAGGPFCPFSVPAPELGGRLMLITGSGHRFRDCARDVAGHACIIRIEDGGSGWRLVWGGGGEPAFRPSSELPSHIAIHAFLRRSGAPERAVLHTHPPGLIALSHLPEGASEQELNRSLRSIHPEVAVSVPGGVGLVPYLLPGHDGLATASLEALQRGRRTVVWQLHGCLAAGLSPIDAFDSIDILEKAAGIALLVRAAGHRPSGLTDAQLDELTGAFGPAP